MIDRLFNTCVDFLNWLGKVTGLTYVEISVVFNLWVQGGLLVISALIPFVIAMTQYFKNTGNLLYVMLTGILLLFYGIVFYWIFTHYGTSMQNAFDLCVEDLLRLAKQWHTTYYMVNIIIFVMGWLLAFGINIYVTWKLTHWS